MVRVLILLISVCLFTAVASAQRVDDILGRAGRFVEETSARLSGVIADETYVQGVFTQFVDNSSIRPRIAQRSVRAEALFLRLPVANEWMFVRNVLMVDGRSIRDSGERLDRLFRDSGIDAGAYVRRLQEENARFDIGGVSRTFGDPTFALRYLELASQMRFAFNRVGTERIGGVRATTLAYYERRRPFVVKVDGRDAQSSGMMWVDAADGAVMRTNLRVARPLGRGMVASITVDFEKETRLGVWVPTKMSEQYNAANGETTTTTASYVNFRRFDASVRVITPEDPN